LSGVSFGFDDDINFFLARTIESKMIAITPGDEVFEEDESSSTVVSMSIISNTDGDID
jgi:hypothetical protein